MRTYALRCTQRVLRTVVYRLSLDNGLEYLIRYFNMYVWFQCRKYHCKTSYFTTLLSHELKHAQYRICEKYRGQNVGKSTFGSPNTIHVFRNNRAFASVLYRSILVFIARIFQITLFYLLVKTLQNLMIYYYLVCI